MICATRVRNEAAVAETAVESSTEYDAEERDGGPDDGEGRWRCNGGG
jgi:hypothetical protein